MEPRISKVRPLKIYTPKIYTVSAWSRPAKMAIAATLGAVLLTSCVSDPFYPQADAPQASPSSSEDTAASYTTPLRPTTDTPTAQSTPVQSTPDPSTAASEFVFPQDSCGDRSTELNVVWYPVYIDGADLTAVRQKYCGDAISAVRDKTGKPSVQVASFINYDKALKFARAVGGEVESTAGGAAAGGAAAGDSMAANGQNSTPGGSLGRSSNSSLNRSPDDAANSSSPNSPTADSSVTDKTAYLDAQNPNAAVNVREQASTSSPVLQTGSVGDRIQISEKTQGDDGYTWYHVRFDSGTKGWVRGDFVSDQAAIAKSSDSSSRASTMPSATTDSSPPDSANSGSARLTASDPSSPINVREQASTSSHIRYLGYAGDRVRIANTIKGDDGYTWYSVQFDSGAIGWIRSDFIVNN